MNLRFRSINLTPTAVSGTHNAQVDEVRESRMLRVRRSSFATTTRSTTPFRTCCMIASIPGRLRHNATTAFAAEHTT